MEPIGPVLAIARLALVVGLLFLLPGIAIGPHLAPGATTPLARLGRAAGFGILAAMAGSTVLALLGLFRPTIVATVLAGLAILPLHADAPGWRRAAVGSRRWLPIGAAFGTAALALVIVPGLIVAGPGAAPLTPPSWAAVPPALVLADAGALPVDYPAWNGATAISPTTLPAVAHLAAAIQLLPGDLPTRLTIYRLAILVATALVGAALLRRWLPSWAAMLAAGLFVGLASAGGSNGGSTLGSIVAGPWVALALLAVWIADRALAERSVRLLGAAAIVGAALVACRPELFLVAAAGVAGVAAARLLVAPGGGPETAGGMGHRYGRRLGLRREFGRRAFGSVSAIAVVIVLAAGAGSTGAGALTLVVPAGQVLGAVSGGGAAEDPVERVPASATEGTDRTAAFARSVEPDTAGLTANGLVAVPTAVSTALLATTPAGPGVASVLLGGTLLATLGTWPVLDARRQRLVAAVLTFALIVVITGALVLAADGPFAARRIAVDTLLPMLWLAGAASVGAVGWLAARAVARSWGHERIGRAGARAPRLAGPLIGAVLAFAVASSAAVALASAERATGAALSTDAVAAYRYLAAETPVDARVLANGRTDGIIPALASRTGVLDGPDPDPDDDALLDRATSLMTAARAVFVTPASPASAAFLARERITHVVVGGGLGTSAPFPADLDALRAAPDLREIASFGDVHLFEVLSSATPGALPTG